MGVRSQGLQGPAAAVMTIWMMATTSRPWWAHQHVLKAMECKAKKGPGPPDATNRCTCVQPAP